MCTSMKFTKQGPITYVLIFIKMLMKTSHVWYHSICNKLKNRNMCQIYAFIKFCLPLRSHRTNQPISSRLTKYISNKKVKKLPSKVSIRGKFVFMNMIFVVNYFSMFIPLHLSLFRYCFRVFYHENPFGKEQLI